MADASLADEGRRRIEWARADAGVAPGAVYQIRAAPAQFFSERIDPECVVMRPQDGGAVNRAALCFKD